MSNRNGNIILLYPSAGICEPNELLPVCFRKIKECLQRPDITVCWPDGGSMTFCLANLLSFPGVVLMENALFLVVWKI